MSPGRVAGRVVLVADRPPAPPARPLPAGADAEAEAERVRLAADAVRDELLARAERHEGDARDVLETTAAMAGDPMIVAAASDAVLRDRRDPARAVWEAADTAAATLTDIGGYLAERVTDVEDVRDRIIAALDGLPMPGIPDLDAPAVLVARDITPVDTAGLDPDLVLALLTAEGGPTSHTAILARGLGIPAVVGLGAGIADLGPGTRVLVDGGAGSVVVDADEGAEADFAASAHAGAALPRFDGRGATSDGHLVHLYANVASRADAEAAAAAGAEGIGLLRTEVLFLGRSTEPDVETQAEAYAQLMAPFEGRTVVVRTLDAGSDKPVPYLTSPEPNPALGVRGLRTARRSPAVLSRQLDAIAQAARRSGARVRVMAPMVSTVDEVDGLLEAAAAHGLADVGIMVETPAAALLADALLARATFASIGTNDLVQYTMAADRALGALAGLSSPWQPAVLRLVRSTCAGGEQQARDIGVCGEAASDPALAVVLVGLGVTSLSMGARSIPAVAAVLRDTDLATCRRLAGLALGCESAQDARTAVRRELPVLDELGL